MMIMHAHVYGRAPMFVDCDIQRHEVCDLQRHAAIPSVMGVHVSHLTDNYPSDIHQTAPTPPPLLFIPFPFPVFPQDGCVNIKSFSGHIFPGYHSSGFNCVAGDATVSDFGRTSFELPEPLGLSESSSRWDTK